MKCCKCGEEIVAGEKFCSSCGEKVISQSGSIDSMYNTNLTVKKKSSSLLKIGIILQGIVGIAFIIASFYTNFDYGKWFSSIGYTTGNSVNYSYYGGDAYTGIQQAAAQTATNVKDLSVISLYGFELTANNVGQFSWVFIQFTHIFFILFGFFLIANAIKEYGKIKFWEE